MATAKITDNSKLVTNYIQKLGPVLAEVVEAIRQIILHTDKEIGEQIKWNSPSFIYTGAMKPFNPKEYRRDIVVINIHKGFALLVFPTGSRVKNRHGLLEGDFKDGRRLAKFYNMEDVTTKENALKMVIQEWLKLVDN